MLNVMSVVNERQCILPLLRHLYLNNMNLDYRSLHGIVCYLFPVRRFRRARDGSQPRPDRTIAGEEFGIPPEVYFPFRGTPRRALFPSLSVLSLCDNPGIGNGGLVELLRCLIAPHFEERVLPVLDLSRCGIDEVGARYIREYIEKLPAVLNDDNTGIAVQRIVLYGNRHSMS
ncbi:unnamed protein product [Trypanosoma congolense IL3000]|nr:unnamed protein product [Trypanosoma congolense IL3000]